MRRHDVTVAYAVLAGEPRPSAGQRIETELVLPVDDATYTGLSSPADEVTGFEGNDPGPVRHGPPSRANAHGDGRSCLQP
jgi:hypothetical protein